MQKTKVLNIIKSLGRGGAEMLLPETLRLHDRNTFDFHYIYFLPWKDAMVEEIRAQGGTVICIPANNNIQLILKAYQVADYIRRENIDVIHAHLPWAGIVARVAGKITGVPVVYTEHNKQERYHFATRWMNLFTMNWLTRVVAVSEDVERSIRKHKKRLKAPLQKILNGVNTERFSPGVYSGKDVRTQLAIPHDAFVIGTVAVFRFQKRLDLWIDIAAKILQLHPGVHFVIVGDGPLKGLLEEKRIALGLTDNLHFTGVQTEVRPYLAAFDTFMMSSVFEGLPIALLEAMASGVPAIVTDAGGIKETVRHEQDGLVCAVDDPWQLVNFASAMITNVSKRQALARAGRAQIEEQFSMQRMVVELEEVYRKIKIY